MIFVVLGLYSFSAVPSPPVQSDEYLEKLPNCQPAAPVNPLHWLRTQDLLPIYLIQSIYTESIHADTLYTHLSVSSKIVSVETAN